MRLSLWAAGEHLSRLAEALRELTLGDLAGAAASGLLLVALWWPLAAAAVAGGWSVFVKAGRPGWTSLVPVYNALQFLRIARAPAWWLALLLVPGVNVAVYAATCLRMARAFGQEPRFAAGLFMAPPIFVAVLGLGPARYRRLLVVPGGRPPDGSGPGAVTGLPLAAELPRLAAVR
jgi:hypothetical protein